MSLSTTFGGNSIGENSQVRKMVKRTKLLEVVERRPQVDSNIKINMQTFCCLPIKMKSEWPLEILSAFQTSEDSLLRFHPQIKGSGSTGRQVPKSYWSQR